MSCKDAWEKEVAQWLAGPAKVAPSQADGGQRCTHAGCDALVNQATGVCVKGHRQGTAVSVPADEQMVEAAQTAYDGSEIQVDAEATVSRSDENEDKGAYVEAWIRLDAEEVGDADDAALIALAQEQYQEGGTLEIDDGAVVTRDGETVLVQGWVWVYDDAVQPAKGEAAEPGAKGVCDGLLCLLGELQAQGLIEPGDRPIGLDEPDRAIRQMLDSIDCRVGIMGNYELGRALPQEQAVAIFDDPRVLAARRYLAVQSGYAPAEAPAALAREITAMVDTLRGDDPREGIVYRLSELYDALAEHGYGDWQSAVGYLEEALAMVGLRGVAAGLSSEPAETRTRETPELLAASLYQALRADRDGEFVPEMLDGAAAVLRNLGEEESDWLEEDEETGARLWRAVGNAREVAVELRSMYRRLGDLAGVSNAPDEARRRSR